MTFMQARAVMRERLTTLEKMHRNYVSFQQDRVNERDHDGAAYAAMRLQGDEREMAGIRMCLETLDQVDMSKVTFPAGTTSLPGPIQVNGDVAIAGLYSPLTEPGKVG